MHAIDFRRAAGANSAMLPARRSNFSLSAVTLVVICAVVNAASAAGAYALAASDSEPAGAADKDALSTFMSSIRSHCGRAFEGRIVANEPAPANDPFTGKRLVMHVLQCSEEIRIPFHVGDDHSRTWVITRKGAALRLEHDHRHEDGTEDAITRYGGESQTPGTAVRQEFPADQRSKELFLLHGMAVSQANVWALEIEPGRRFVYELARPGRLFRVEFDLSRQVDPPPEPWGYERWR